MSDVIDDILGYRDSPGMWSMLAFLEFLGLLHENEVIKIDQILIFNISCLAMQLTRSCINLVHSRNIRVIKQIL